MRLIAFDLETTGLDVQNDRIIEFCFLEVDAALAPKGAAWTSLVDPGRPIPAIVQKVTSITDGMVSGKAAFATHAPRIQKLVEGATLIAHNGVRFDIPFLHHELVRAGQPGLAPDHPCIDTYSIENLVNANSLEACFQRYTGRSLEGGHRSQADVEATVEVLRHQVQAHEARLGSDATALVQSHLEQLRDPEARPRKWLDHRKCFYEDSEGQIRFGFTKEHRDTLALQNEGLLRWMSSKDFPADTQAIVQRLLDQIAQAPAPA